MEAENGELLYGDYVDPESLQVDEKQRTRIRNGLIRKVYGILLSQLALTTVISAAFTLNTVLRGWIVANGSWLVILSSVAALSTVVALQCIPGLSRKHPTNLYLLFGFTFAESIGIACICALMAARGQITVILQALVITSLITLGLTAYAMQTSKDFTKMSGILSVLIIGVLGFGILRFLFPQSSVLETIYCIMGATIFGAYIVVDTQRLVGGKASQVSEDEYVSISLELYADVIGLFLNILELLYSRRDE